MTIRRRAAVVLTAGVLTVGMAASAFAADTVVQTLNAGTRSASVADLTLTAADYSHDDQTSTGTMTLTADDSTGAGDGWNVTVQSSAFAYTGDNGGTAIPATNFALTSAAAPTSTSGQAIDATNGPKVPATSPVGTLDQAREVLEANAESGLGTYTQDLGVALTVPGQSRAGTYTGTLTTTIAAGPGA